MAEQSALRFLGSWKLDPASSKYQQGDAPLSGTYAISAEGETLVFDMAWQDASGQDQTARFSGKPDGVAAPFPNTDLIDRIAIKAESNSEIAIAAYLGDEMLMRTSHILIDEQTMRVVQTVYLPDGTSPSNRSVYYRRGPGEIPS
ncbi:hypothetical protein [Henriciella sp.]|uniref:hypothetical protein n=1 Tax=Henriciella sp. TaxID=1968823 RepID=UPI00262D6A4E|nr:hypothetical protein [Henriciella sp.]